MIVFLRFGEFITGGDHFPLTSDALTKVLTGKASMEIFQSILHAVCSLCMFPFFLSLTGQITKSKEVATKETGQMG